MGCYAAVSRFALAYHVVRSEPEARVLVVTVELSTLHLQDETEIEPLLAMLQFGDGAAAALVTAEPSGFAISRPFAATLEQARELIRWTIGDRGFAMRLSGEVPGRIAEALRDPAVRATMLGGRAAWRFRQLGDPCRRPLGARRGRARPRSAAGRARRIARTCSRGFGNMSSSTLPFVLADLLADAKRRAASLWPSGPASPPKGSSSSAPRERPGSPSRLCVERLS